MAFIFTGRLCANVCDRKIFLPNTKIRLYRANQKDSPRAAAALPKETLVFLNEKQINSKDNRLLLKPSRMRTAITPFG